MWVYEYGCRWQWERALPGAHPSQRVNLAEALDGCVGDIAAMSAGVGDVPQPARTPAAIDSSRSRVRKVPPALL